MTAVWFKSLPRLRKLLWVYLASCTFCLSGPVLVAEASPSGRHASEATIRRIEELRREVARHDDLYFRQAAPEITDFEYDQLKAELLRLEEKYPNQHDGAPSTELVGDDRTGAFATRPHLVPMLSLDKAMSEGDLLAFHRRVSNQLGRAALVYWVEPKFDGIAVSLTYEHGKLVRAVTRGNGVEGDDVTANVRMIEGVPLHLRSAREEEEGSSIPELIEIRGEIFMSFAEFSRINAERASAGESIFANPRNLAAGTIKLHDPADAAERRLELACFGWGAFLPAEKRPDTLVEFQKRLTAWGLPGVSRASRAVGLAKMLTAVQAVETSRADLPYPIDGAVVKLASTVEQETLGWGQTSPRWAVAMKFAPERVTARLLGITLQVGRTGLITPVAELEPVWLAGSSVARTTLHNADEIARRDLRIGDLVVVEKAGDIIPAIVGVDLARRAAGSKAFLFPTDCPECGAELERLEGSAAHRCANEECPALVKRRLAHYATAMNIKGLGPATIAALVETVGLRTPADLYLLTREDLLPIPGLGEWSAEKLLAAIDASKRADWESLVYAVGIPGVGTQRARALAKGFADYDALAQASLEQLTVSESAGGPGFGQATAAAVLSHLEKPSTRDLFHALDEVGVRAQPPLAPSGAFAGEVVVLTGALRSWTRAEVTTRLVQAGATMGSNVTGKTTLLVAGERPGAKLERAAALGVPVIDERELVRRLE